LDQRLSKLGKILLNRGQVAEASRYLREAFALEYARKADDFSMLTEVLILLDGALRRAGKPSEAEPFYRQAWDIIGRYPAGLPSRAAVAQRYEALLRQIGIQDTEVDKRLGIRREPGVIEGEDLVVQGKTSGIVGPQDMRDWSNQWSGAHQLWWRDQDRGAALTIELQKEPGTYDIVARFTKAPDYGIAELSIDDQKLDMINLYNKEVIPSSPIRLGTVTLRKRPHVLVVTILDKDPKSSGDYQYGFGLDWIKLTATDSARKASGMRLACRGGRRDPEHLLVLTRNRAWRRFLSICYGMATVSPFRFTTRSKCRTSPFPSNRSDQVTRPARCNHQHGRPTTRI
jgi:hypothetical protein